MRWLKTMINKLSTLAKSTQQFEGYGARFLKREPKTVASIKQGVRDVRASEALFFDSTRMEPFANVADMVVEGRNFQQSAYESSVAVARRAEHAHTDNDAIRMDIAAGVLEKAADAGGVASRSQVAKLLKAAREKMGKEIIRGA